MGLLGGLKKIGKVVGGVAKQAAPVISMVPGVGTVAGAAIGGLGSLASGDNLKTAIGYGVKGAMPGMLGKLAGAGGIAGKAGSILGGLKKVGGGSIGGSGALSGLPMPSIGKAPRGGVGGIIDSLGGIGGIGGSILGGLKKIGVDDVLGGASLGYGAYQMKKAGDLRNKSLKMVEDEYRERAPLRKVGLSGLMNEQRPDLSQVFASQNPFARRV